MENICFQNWPVNDAPPKVFFPPKTSLTRELEYKKKRPILEHISTSISSPHKLALKPTTSHPLNHQITTSPITPPFFKKFNKNDDLLLVGKRHSSPKIDGTVDNNEKKMVIVHEIKPSDTIAGVALFYGIEISILKKANKLWTNDSIHLHHFQII
ncbi:carbohydrate-binding module family 50 protein [Rhizophagus irregularis DAOM 181602=DAOM 197198]|uniref:Carbohydrate-binding module family 50 protein n=1 Tax=Rhizophagus irregularis (strain DAOM 181602 / DAOM 197198 / MUCL 43194) TaxID=747089 RepID=A0A2P4PEW0_RHIID|nr:carbohydrate-binding module family 50 protein [Rhizophagus irregularis DAOM 181602=DAOM 197198]POG63926.1 carbohydrate-binding module family 50 protein [Rhizophagus irregularis DAOM 181602=DAOM 197198]|eukprot:XP_025170792.1 carbohydrate-binding module family 50 protein [Rhizophagus irregularis DAOM 181602=DAOM 197198]